MRLGSTSKGRECAVPLVSRNFNIGVVGSGGAEIFAEILRLGPFSRYATSCAAHRFKEAGGCEAEMMFVRRGDFNKVKK